MYDSIACVIVYNYKPRRGTPNYRGTNLGMTFIVTFEEALKGIALYASIKISSLRDTLDNHWRPLGV